MKLSSVPIKRKMGIELTFVTSRDLGWSTLSAKWDNLAWEYEKRAIAAKMDHAKAIHADPGCVEYPSPILKSWRGAKDFYTKACSIAADLNLVPFQKDQEGGMGHIHIEMSEEEHAKMIGDIAGRPYLTWILATPNGSSYCKSILRAIITDKVKPKFGPDGGTPTEAKVIEQNGYYWSNSTSTANTYVINSDGNAITFSEEPVKQWNMPTDRFCIAPYNRRYGTLEFRAFDAAADWDIQEEHIAFIQRYTQVILSKPYWGIPMTNDTTFKECARLIKVYREDIDLCIKDFKALIVDTLELPWDRYEWYIERNLVPAFEWGKRR